MKHYAPNRCETRIEVIVKMRRKSRDGVGGVQVRSGGVRVDVNQELKSCCENAKTKVEGGGSGSVWGARWM